MMDGREREQLDWGAGHEAVSFMMELGICPGSECPRAIRGCDPRCPVLVAWVEEVVDG